MFWCPLLIIGLSVSVLGSSGGDDNDNSNLTSSLEGKDANFTVLSVCDINGVVQLANPDDCEKAVAFGSYKNTVNLTGWAQLKIETFEEYSPELQAYAAGVLEGTLSRTLIEYYIQNIGAETCVGPNISCPNTKDFLKQNNAYIKQHINENNKYWQSVRRTYYQLTGMLHGYQGTPDFANPQIDFSLHDIFMLQLAGDFITLKELPNPTADFPITDLHCSALIKLTKDDLLAAHSAWYFFKSMLRVLKHYKFGLDIPGNTQSFSGYPGVIVSFDDFYTLSSGLVVTETSNGIYNVTVYDAVKPQEQVLYWLRVIAANQLATSGAEWIKIFAEYNSGTYNNQWMVVDYNNYDPAKEFPDTGVLYILEQIPGYIHSADLTSVLKETSYWPSYNIPYFSDISNMSGYNPTEYHDDVRARMFARDHHKVVDMDTLRELLRYNNYEHDPLSSCNCTPPYNAGNSIAARYDLNPGGNAYGATDYKGTNYNMVKQLQFNAICSPAYDDVPAFRWSTSNFNNVTHIGMPDLWQFEEVTTDWNTTIPS